MSLRPAPSASPPLRVLIVAGEAGSHCVRASVEHLVLHLPSARPERIVLLTVC